MRKNSMRKNKKGFTIVELVIVIAVIAILAAVLIPTFSSLVQKANLSADMQAVREMNIALQADETLHGKAETIDDAMRVIANAGYDADNWTCLTSGYEVYWYRKDNRCVLYNASAGVVEYPKEYSVLDVVANAEDFLLYNQTYKNALEVELNFSSSSATVSDQGVGLQSGSDGNYEFKFESSTAGTDKTVELSSKVVEQFEKFGINKDSAKLYGYNSSADPGKAGAVLESYAIYDDDHGPEYSSSGKLKANVYQLSISKGNEETMTPQELTAAEKAAGDLVYSLFVQMNNGSVVNDANIVIEGGTTLNISGKEWQGAKLFAGYFGSTDSDNPVIIDGMRLTDSSGYINAYKFEGSTSTYYLCGFFGGITSNKGEKTTIENITFRNVNIVDPASDYAYAKPDANDSNCAGIIGGIIGTDNNETIDVTLSNIKVESSCSVRGVARVGGLVAFIGGSSGTHVTSCGGSVKITRCDINCDVTTEKINAYGTCGGIVGFVNKMQGGNLDLTIEDCKYSGKLTGITIGGIIAKYDPTNADTDNDGVKETIHCGLTLKNVESRATYEFNAAAAKVTPAFGYIVGSLAKGAQEATTGAEANSGIGIALNFSGLKYYIDSQEFTHEDVTQQAWPKKEGFAVVYKPCFGNGTDRPAG